MFIFVISSTKHNYYQRIIYLKNDMSMKIGDVVKDKSNIYYIITDISEVILPNGGKYKSKIIYSLKMKIQSAPSNGTIFQVDEYEFKDIFKLRT